MKIHGNNYEAFFLDYHEGNLDAQSKQDVLAFVSAHPELREEFESFEIISLSDKTSVTFPGKEKLKKNSITEYNYRTWLVAFVENDLPAEGRKEVERFIQAHPVYAKE